MAGCLLALAECLLGVVEFAADCLGWVRRRRRARARD
jgi:hypothetical protein